MDIKIDGFYNENTELYQMTLDLRQSIFVDELGFDKHLEFDGIDNKATHYIVLVDGRAVGCARLIETTDKIKIERFGILKSYRGWGLGLLLLKFIKREVLASKKKIEWICTEDSVLFFIQQGLKDSNQFESFGKKRLRILYL
jgi:predicted GNAT family N-acyltransferase